MAIRALTLNDFRAMIGTSDYGEVRLSENGGLEKVNQHFLQRHNIKRAEVSGTERLIIAQSLSNVLSGEVSESCMSRIRALLGVETDIENGVASNRPLTCRTIRTVIELADRDRWGEHSISQVDLKAAITAYNAQAGRGERIRLSSDELKMLQRRHGRELAGRFNGEGQQLALGTAIKHIVTHENLKGGSSALGLSGVRAQSAAVANEVGNAMTKTSLLGNIQAALSLRAERLYALDGQLAGRATPTDMRRILTEGEPFLKTDFGKKNLAKISQDDLKNEVMASFGGLSTELAGRIINYVANDTALQIARNKMTCTIGDKTYSLRESATEDVVQEDVDADRQIIKEIGMDLLNRFRKITPLQLVASLKIFNQQVYNMPKIFRLPSARFDRSCAISFDGNDVKVTFDFQPTAKALSGDDHEGLGPIRWEYRVDKDGMMQTEYLGKAAD